MDVKMRWNSTLMTLERAYRLHTYTAEWLGKYPEYAMLQTTNNEWRAIEYLMEILEPFRYYTLWMSKQRNVTIHLVIRIYNDLFDHFDKILKVLKNKRTSWKIECYKAVEAARNKLREYYSKLTPKTGLLMILAVCLDPEQKLAPFKRWDKEEAGMTNYSQDYRTAFLSYFETHYAPLPENHDE